MLKVNSIATATTRKAASRDPTFDQLQLFPLPGINTWFVSADDGLPYLLLLLPLSFLLKKKTQPKINILFELT